MNFLREAASPGETGGVLPASEVEEVIGRGVGGVPRGGERGGKLGDQKERAGIKIG